MNRAHIDEILELPPSERVAIVQEIWESIAADTRALPLTTGQREELERRWLDLQANPSDEDSWDDVKRSLRSK